MELEVDKERQSLIRIPGYCHLKSPSHTWMSSKQSRKEHLRDLINPLG